MKNHVFALALLSVFLMTACTSTQLPEGLQVRLTADPASVYSATGTLVHIDVDNRNDRQIENVFVQLFDTGLLFGDPCEKEFLRLLPFEFQTIDCRLSAPKVETSQSTEINALVDYTTKFSASQLFSVISEDEQQRRIAVGDYSRSPKSYSYRDRNVEIQVDFSEEPPLAALPDKKYFIYFTIRNIGDGFIQYIEPGQLKLKNADPRLPVDFLKCSQLQTLYPSGKEFPRIACEVVLPKNTFQTQSAISSNFIIELDYKYEIRSKLGIEIVK